MKGQLKKTTSPTQDDTLRITEIFHSIQGESSYAGLPCVFIRLTGCNLRCTYCDTAYAFEGGHTRSFDDILAEVAKFGCSLVEITGGEPLVQKATPALAKKLLEAQYRVLIETSGAQDISVLDGQVIKIMDLKTPSSGECDKNLWSNISALCASDEVKFVIGDRRDYEWARDVVQKQLSSFKGTKLFSPVFSPSRPTELAQWILDDKLPVRFQLQLHKYIWDPNRRGV